MFIYIYMSNTIFQEAFSAKLPGCLPILASGLESWQNDTALPECPRSVPRRSQPPRCPPSAWRPCNPWSWTPPTASQLRPGSCHSGPGRSVGGHPPTVPPWCAEDVSLGRRWNESELPAGHVPRSKPSCFQWSPCIHPSSGLKYGLVFQPQAVL